MFWFSNKKKIFFFIMHSYLEASKERNNYYLFVFQSPKGSGLSRNVVQEQKKDNQGNETKRRGS